MLKSGFRNPDSQIANNPYEYCYQVLHLDLFFHTHIALQTDDSYITQTTGYDTQCTSQSLRHILRQYSPNNRYCPTGFFIHFSYNMVQSLQRCPSKQQQCKSILFETCMTNDSIIFNHAVYVIFSRTTWYLRYNDIQQNTNNASQYFFNNFWRQNNCGRSTRS